MSKKKKETRKGSPKDNSSIGEEQTPQKAMTS
jgi:hypothetical protein